jgi:hypothetical protein
VPPRGCASLLYPAPGLANYVSDQRSPGELQSLASGMPFNLGMMRGLAATACEFDEPFTLDPDSIVLEQAGRNEGL